MKSDRLLQHQQRQTLTQRTVFRAGVGEGNLRRQHIIRADFLMRGDDGVHIRGRDKTASAQRRRAKVQRGLPIGDLCHALDMRRGQVICEHFVFLMCGFMNIIAEKTPYLRGF